MSEPGFFIIGAPKSGTTALASYLAAHPDIMMAVPKEPHFFCTDMRGYRWARRWEQYLSLFSAAAPGQLCGEASVFYLYSGEAAQAIRKAYPGAKLVAILRRPDEMVYSFYRQLRFNRQEDQREFRVAWELERERRSGRHIPALCRDQKTLYYRSIACYAEQLARVYRNFPVEQVEVLFYDDFARDPGSTYRRVLGFLGIRDDGRTDFPAVNAHRVHRSAALQSGLRWSFDRLHALRLSLQERTGLDASKLYLHRPVTNFVARLNEKGAPKPKLDSAMRREIIGAYREDIDRLAELTGRNLADWLR